MKIEKYYKIMKVISWVSVILFGLFIEYVISISFPFATFVEIIARLRVQFGINLRE